RILEQIAKTGLMAEENVHLLNTAYKEYRNYLHHMALQEQGGLIADSEFQEYRQQVSNIWNSWLEAG
ncbi:MAG: glutamate-ammonia-ligase adenylyltransferase, partial [Gammaproteobacteria bacterium]|nr:glutamate-ammonia-ligase adenylyltransferase [Gammaproteobacteria bacterium]